MPKATSNLSSCGVSRYACTHTTTLLLASEVAVHFLLPPSPRRLLALPHQRCPPRSSPAQLRPSHLLLRDCHREWDRWGSERGRGQFCFSNPVKRGETPPIPLPEFIAPAEGNAKNIVPVPGTESSATALAVSKSPGRGEGEKHGSGDWTPCQVIWGRFLHCGTIGEEYHLSGFGVRAGKGSGLVSVGFGSGFGLIEGWSLL